MNALGSWWQLAGPLVSRLVPPLNAIGRVGRRAGLDARSLLRADLLLRAAEDETGLSDWGPTDFREALDVLLSSCLRESALTLVGAVYLRSQLIHLLSGRLRIHHTLATSPDVALRSVPRTVFVVGFPRTGTTLLQRLLALDPAARAPLFWELTFPTSPTSPPPARSPEDIERIRRARKMVRAAYAGMPGLRDIHPLGAEEPAECQLLLQHTLANESFFIGYHAPTYRAWFQSLGHEPMTAIYAYHRQLLRILTARHSGRHVVLKWPFHLAHLDALFEIYPDACVAHTHRNPVETVASLASLTALMRAPRTESFDVRRIGRETASILHDAIERARSVRSRGDREARIADLRYLDLVRDPIAVVRGLYERFGLLYEPSFERRMSAWLARVRHGEPSRHRYSPEAFGISAGEIRRQFAGYVSDFAVPA